MAVIKIHMCMDVQGALNNMKYPDHYFGVFLNDDGSHMHPAKARQYLYDQLAMGHKVIPCSPCDNFDYSGKGCLGHPVEREEAA